MLEGLNSAAAGMAAQQQRLDSVANDLANANTTGYKHGRVGFRDLIYDVCGGIPKGRKLKGLIPGGSSMPPLDASEIDVPIEFDALMTDARIKDVEVKPGVPFDMGGMIGPPSHGSRWHACWDRRSTVTWRP